MFSSRPTFRSFTHFWQWRALCTLRTSDFSFFSWAVFRVYWTYVHGSWVFAYGDRIARPWFLKTAIWLQGYAATVRLFKRFTAMCGPPGQPEGQHRPYAGITSAFEAIAVRSRRCADLQPYILLR